MSEREPPRKSRDRKSAGPTGNIDKGRETILARAKAQLSQPGANRGRIMAETLGQLYALSKDAKLREQYRKDINKLD